MSDTYMETISVLETCLLDTYRLETYRQKFYGIFTEIASDASFLIIHIRKLSDL